MTTRFALTLAAIALSGCCTLPTDVTTSNSVPLNEVISRLKDDISAFYAVAPISVAKGSQCSFDADAVTPASFTVTLQTVALTKNEPGASLTAPYGIFKFDPALGGSFSNTSTVTTTIPLSIKGNPPKPTSSDQQAVHALQEKHPIGYALWTLREELIKVDHSKPPCFGALNADKPMTVKVSFDVVDAKNGGFTFQLVGLKLQNKTTITDEYHQTLTFDVPLTTQLLFQQ